MRELRESKSQGHSPEEKKKEISKNENEGQDVWVRKKETSDKIGMDLGSLSLSRPRAVDNHSKDLNIGSDSTLVSGTQSVVARVRLQPLLLS